MSSSPAPSTRAASAGPPPSIPGPTTELPSSSATDTESSPRRPAASSKPATTPPSSTVDAAASSLGLTPQHRPRYSAAAPAAESDASGQTLPQPPHPHYAYPAYFHGPPPPPSSGPPPGYPYDYSAMAAAAAAAAAAGFPGAAAAAASLPPRPFATPFRFATPGPPPPPFDHHHGGSTGGAGAPIPAWYSSMAATAASTGDADPPPLDHVSARSLALYREFKRTQEEGDRIRIQAGQFPLHLAPHAAPHPHYQQALMHQHFLDAQPQHPPPHPSVDGPSRPGARKHAASGGKKSSATAGGGDLAKRVEPAGRGATVASGIASGATPCPPVTDKFPTMKRVEKAGLVRNDQIPRVTAAALASSSPGPNADAPLGFRNLPSRLAASESARRATVSRTPVRFSFNGSAADAATPSSAPAAARTRTTSTPATTETSAAEPEHTPGPDPGPPATPATIDAMHADFCAALLVDLPDDPDGILKLERFEAAIDFACTSCKNKGYEGDKQDGFMRTLMAVHTIVKDKLYRARQCTMEQYFTQFHKISRAQVYRLLDCHTILMELHDFAVRPFKQRICRTLKKVAPNADTRRKLWQAVLDRYRGNVNNLTSGDITSTWREFANNDPQLRDLLAAATTAAAGKSRPSTSAARSRAAARASATPGHDDDVSSVGTATPAGVLPMQHPPMAVFNNAGVAPPAPLGIPQQPQRASSMAPPSSTPHHHAAYPPPPPFHHHHPHGHAHSPAADEFPCRLASFSPVFLNQADDRVAPSPATAATIPSSSARGSRNTSLPPIPLPARAPSLPPSAPAPVPAASRLVAALDLAPRFPPQQMQQQRVKSASIVSATVTPIRPSVASAAHALLQVSAMTPPAGGWGVQVKAEPHAVETAAVSTPTKPKARAKRKPVASKADTNGDEPPVKRRRRTKKSDGEPAADGEKRKAPRKKSAAVLLPVPTGPAVFGPPGVPFSHQVYVQHAPMEVDVSMHQPVASVAVPAEPMTVDPAPMTAADPASDPAAPAGEEPVHPVIELPKPIKIPPLDPTLPHVTLSTTSSGQPVLLEPRFAADDWDFDAACIAKLACTPPALHRRIASGAWSAAASSTFNMLRPFTPTVVATARATPRVSFKTGGGEHSRHASGGTDAGMMLSHRTPRGGLLAPLPEDLEGSGGSGALSLSVSLSATLMQHHRRRASQPASSAPASARTNGRPSLPPSLMNSPQIDAVTIGIFKSPNGVRGSRLIPPPSSAQEESTHLDDAYAMPHGMWTLPQHFHRGAMYESSSGFALPPYPGAAAGPFTPRTGMAISQATGVPMMVVDAWQQQPQFRYAPHGAEFTPANALALDAGPPDAAAAAAQRDWVVYGDARAASADVQPQYPDAAQHHHYHHHFQAGSGIPEPVMVDAARLFGMQTGGNGELHPDDAARLISIISPQYLHEPSAGSGGGGGEHFLDAVSAAASAAAAAACGEGKQQHFAASASEPPPTPAAIESSSTMFAVQQPTFPTSAAAMFHAMQHRAQHHPMHSSPFTEEHHTFSEGDVADCSSVYSLPVGMGAGMGDGGAHGEHYYYQHQNSHIYHHHRFAQSQSMGPPPMHPHACPPMPFDVAAQQQQQHYVPPQLRRAMSASAADAYTG
ncbi:hypothetical protein H9P43_006764 [Blastocladiella emersonii ATCC 22665]|nr:hypothetical protein H9P43_006764 [Blastocladiella emersonii ATCC 22665]